MTDDLNDEQKRGGRLGPDSERMGPDRESDHPAADDTVSPGPAAGAQAKAKKRPSLLARLVRWLLAFLIVLGLGALLAIFLLYLPVREEAGALRADLEAANGRITELEGEIERLEGLGTTNESIQSDLERMEVYNTLVSARADVLAAQLALAGEETDRALLALSTTPDKLAELNSALGPDQQPVVDSMIDRLALAQDELETDAFAAQSDLEVLLNSLVEMENTLFATP